MKIDTTTLYTVQETIAKQEFENDMPIYQQVVENEWLNVYKLRKKMGGRLISIKTDCVRVEGGKCPPLSDKIGGYHVEEEKTIVPQKFEHKKIEDFFGKIEDNHDYPTHENTPEIEIDFGLKWNVIYVNVDDHENLFEKLIPKIESLKGGCCIRGPAGMGKSEFAKQMKCYGSEKTLKVAFTNKACEGLDGKTLCNTFGIDFTTGKCSSKKLNQLGVEGIDTIMNDECFQTPSYCMGVLDQIKKHYPSIKHYQIGDPEQLRPVGEEKYNWLESAVFHNIVDGNIVCLIHNNRNDCDEEYKRVLDGDLLEEFMKPVSDDCKVHICRTNRVRREINDQHMEGDVHIKWDIEKHNPKGQDVKLSVGTPVMSVVNDKELEMVNSKMYKITAIDDANVQLGDIVLDHDDFMKKCVVAYAFTNHKVQSITIREPYHIHEWTKMNNRERYTAFSRTGHRDLVSLF